MSTHDLKWLELKGTRPGPQLLVTGGVHGDEYEPMAAIRRLMAEIPPGGIAGRLTLVPVVNEPAFERGSRTAEDGLDLARTCPGRPDGSVTERIAHALSQLIRAAEFYIDLHSGGIAMRVLPLTGYMLHPDPAVLERQRQMARAFNLPIVWGTDARLEGRSLSVARDAKVPAIYAEYQGGGGCDPAGVEAYVKGCLNVMGSLGMIDRAPPRSAVERVIEDARPSSGHMQVCHPSPITGFFEPGVALGMHVRTGDLLGSISHATGGKEQVRCGGDGIVIVLHTLPRVQKGEGLAVILETGRAAK